MKRLNFKPLIFAAIALFSFSACNDDNESTKSKISPDECKSRMDRIGQTVIGKINAFDHKELAKTIDKFCENLDYGDIEFQRDVTVKAKSFAKSLHKMIAGNQLSEVTKMTSAQSELYALSQYYGIYTFDDSTYEWIYTPSKDKLEFRFNMDGNDAVVKVSSNGNETTYNPYPEYDIIVPENIIACISLGNKDLASIKAELNVDDAIKSVKTKIEIDASDYKVVHNLDANKEKAVSDLTFTIKGEQIVKCNAYIDGEYMTDPDNIENAFDGNGDPQDLFKGANGTVVIMNDATIKVGCSHIKNFVNDLDRIDDQVYNWYETYEEEYNQKICDTYNKYLKIELYYNDQPDALVANMVTDLYYDEDDTIYYYDWESGEYKEITGTYSYEQNIVFTSDNSKYSMDSYFSEDNFGNLVDNAEDLADKYESFFKYLW